MVSIAAASVSLTHSLLASDSWKIFTYQTLVDNRSEVTCLRLTSSQLVYRGGGVEVPDTETDTEAEV